MHQAHVAVTKELWTTSLHAEFAVSCLSVFGLLCWLGAVSQLLTATADEAETSPVLLIAAAAAAAAAVAMAAVPHQWHTATRARVLNAQHRQLLRTKLNVPNTESRHIRTIRFFRMHFRIRL